MPGPIWDSRNVLLTKQLGKVEKSPVLEKDGPIKPVGDKNSDPFEQPPLSASEEELLIGHDLPRLPPGVFRRLPGAIIALQKEITGLLKVRR